MLSRLPVANLSGLGSIMIRLIEKIKKKFWLKILKFRPLIRTKYVDRKWAADSADFCSDFEKLEMPDPQHNKTEDQNSMIDVQKYFFQNVQEENFSGILACIMAGADPNVLIEGRTVLDLAVEKRSILTTEYLLLNGAKEWFYFNPV